ncbi:MAG: hypothetical protein AAF539_04925 [Planctomycetota bacterium]
MTESVHPQSSTQSANDGLSHAWTFLKRFVAHPGQVGAIAPSSPALVSIMVDWIDWQRAESVVEYGPGTGVFTEAIVQRKRSGTSFFAIERAAELAAITRARCPGVDVCEASADQVLELLRARGQSHADAIVCGLPWASFSEALQQSIMIATHDALSPGGQFATFAYWQGVALPAGRRFARRLKSMFSSVDRSPTAWRNLPPAFVYRCLK